jgi:hypothetical protein
MSFPRLVHLSPRFVLDGEKMKVTDAQDPAREYEFDDEAPWPRIFLDRQEGWFFRPALALVESGQTVAAVHLVTPLIEALEEHYRGVSSKNNSASFFKARARVIFAGLSPEGIDLLYSGVRCGFTHHGFLKDDSEQYNVLITGGLDSPLALDGDGVLWIDSGKYVEVVRAAFVGYCTRLESDEALRKKFNEVWKKDWHMSWRLPGNGGTL